MVKDKGRYLMQLHGADEGEAFVLLDILMIPPIGSA